MALQKMEAARYAGLTTERLDYLKNYEIKKKPYYNGSNYTYSSNRLHDVLYQCPSNSGDDNTNNTLVSDLSSQYHDNNCSTISEGTAGLKSEVVNAINMRNRRSKCNPKYAHDDIKDIIQNTYSDNTVYNNSHSGYANSSTDIFLSEKGHLLGPKKCLTRHIDDTEIGKYFSTKYAVTDKNTGRTEIMVQRKPGSANVIVQNFSAFDAYATFREENKRKEHPDSFVHTKMGIIPKEGAEQTIRRNKCHAMFTDRLRKDNIAPDNYWLCPTAESEQKKFVCKK